VEVLVAEQIRRMHQDRYLSIWPLGGVSDEWRNSKTGEIVHHAKLFAACKPPPGEWHRVELRASLVELLGEKRADRLREILQEAQSSKAFSRGLAEEIEIARRTFLGENSAAAAARRRESSARIKRTYGQFHQALFSEPEGRRAGSPNSVGSERSKKKRKSDARRRTLAIAAAAWVDPDTPDPRRPDAKAALEREKGLFERVDERRWSIHPFRDADEVVAAHLGDRPSTVKKARLTPKTKS
jgi:hypothetical protein